MLIWDMVGFGIICLKPNHDPNVSMLIWNMVGLGVSGVPNLTMFQIWDVDHISNTGIPKSLFGTYSRLVYKTTTESTLITKFPRTPHTSFLIYDFKVKIFFLNK